MSDLDKLGLLQQFLREEEKGYYAAVGRLVTSYARAEAAARVSVRRASPGLSDKQARIIFGGMRFPDLSERLMRLAKEICDQEWIAELQTLLDQFALIGTQRDRIAHMSSEYDYQLGLVVSNALTAKDADKPESHTFSLPDLVAMADDCDLIFTRFLNIHFSKDPLPPLSLRRLGVGIPWRYTPAGPQKTKGSGRASPRPPKRPRQSSPEKG
ncbi:MAG: hypothetical protein H6870_14775 [Methylobacteriaceae bacterium]|nr:hypothetical protein [Methylobacteriaceae bacterium]